jgi:hypothetical protein
MFCGDANTSICTPFIPYYRTHEVPENCSASFNKVKVKISHYVPGHAFRAPGS